MDREPLKEVEDTQINQEHQFDNIGYGLVDTTIEETRMLRELSLVLGFDGDGFEGELDKALSLLEWAKNRTDSETDALVKIRKLIEYTGDPSKGKTLINKLYVWASLQDNIEDLQKRQGNLENVD